MRQFLPLVALLGACGMMGEVRSTRTSVEQAGAQVAKAETTMAALNPRLDALAEGIARTEALRTALEKTLALVAPLESAARLEDELGRVGAIGPALDRVSALRPTLDRVSALGPSLDGVAGLKPTLDEVATLRADLHAVGALADELRAVGALERPLDKLSVQAGLITPRNIALALVGWFAATAAAIAVGMRLGRAGQRPVLRAARASDPLDGIDAPSLA